MPLARTGKRAYRKHAAVGPTGSSQFNDGALH